MALAQTVATAMLVLFGDVRVGSAEAFVFAVPRLLIVPEFFNATAGIKSK